MARVPRNETAAGATHVYARGVEKRWIFGDDDDRQLYLRLLIGIARHLEWRVLAYCLMGNHVHLLIETTKPNLAKGMQLLHSRYAQIFNLKYGRVGHLFQERYGSRVIRDDRELATILAYIAANPVKAKLCERPEDWPWSSYAATLRDEGHPLVDIPHVKRHIKSVGTPRQVVENPPIRAWPPEPW